jgi:cobalt-zinc-cadmium efflux system outer membrane protein
MSWIRICSLALLLSFGSLKAQDTLYLLDGLRRAKEAHPQLRLQAFELQAVRADIQTARLRPNPILNNQSLQLLRASAFAHQSPWYANVNRQVWWQLTKEIQWPGQRKWRIQQAKEQYEWQQQIFYSEEQRLLRETAIQWLKVWLAQQKKRLLEEALDNLDSLYRINQLRLQKQVISETEVLRVELLVEQYRLQVKGAEQEYQLERLTLQQQLQLSQAPTLPNELDANLNKLPSRDIDSLMRFAAAHHPAWKAQESRVNAQQAAVRLQEKLAIPKPELGIIWNPQNAIPYLGFYGTIALPVFDRNQGEIQKTKIYLAQAQAAQALFEEQLRRELQTHLALLAQQEANLAQAERMLNKANRVQQNVRYAYLNGGTTLIDLLEAQRAWLEWRQQYIEQLNSYHQTHWTLSGLIGSINQWME